jgi:hypothetical protein
MILYGGGGLAKGAKRLIRAAKSIYDDIPRAINKAEYRVRPGGNPKEPFYSATDEGLDLMSEIAQNRGRNPNIPGSGIQGTFGETLGNHPHWGNIHKGSRAPWDVPIGSGADEEYVKFLQTKANQEFFKKNQELARKLRNQNK